MGVTRTPAAGLPVFAGRRRGRSPVGRWRAGPRSLLGSRTSWGPALAIAAAAVVTYLTAFPGAFISDAIIAIAENRALRESREWLAWFGRDLYWGSRLDDPTLYRPLTLVSLLAHLRTTGLQTWPFVLANVGLHAGVSLLAFRLGLRLVGPAGALVGALLFAVHPIHAEPVAWIMGRSELLAAGFGVAACLAALRASDPAERRAERFAVAGVFAYLAASLSKEHAVALVAWLPLPWLLRGVRTREWRPPRAVVWLLAGSLVALGLFLLLREHALTRPHAADSIQRAHTGPLYNPMTGASTPARWLTAAVVVLRYAGLLVWPARLSHSYAYAEVQVSTALGARELAGLVLVGGVLLATLWALHRVPGLGLALALVPITFFPVSNFPFAIGTGMAERLLYFPSVGLCLAAGWGLARLGMAATLARYVPGLPRGVGPWGDTAMAPATGPRAFPWVGPVASAVTLLAVLTLGGRTVVAARTWQSVYARLTSDLVATPRAATVWSALAWEESKHGNQGRAMELVERSLQIYPNSPAAHGILGDIFLRRREAAAAVLQFDRALALAPQHWTLRMNRGRALMEAGRLEEAERELREVVSVAPAEFEAHLFLGGVLLRTGRPREALQHFELAARLEPKAATPFAGLAVAALQLGDQRAAARYGRGAERRGQRMPDSFWNAVGATREEPPRAGGTSDGR